MTHADKNFYAQAAGIRAQRRGRARYMKAVDNRKPLCFMRLRRRRTSACALPFTASDPSHPPCTSCSFPRHPTSC